MVTDEMKKSGGGLIGLGILLMVGGIFCILAPFVAGVAAVWVIGGVLIFVGLATFFNAFQEKGFWLGAGDFLAALLFIAIGIIVLLKPMAALAALGLLVAIYFFMRGIVQVTAAFTIRPTRGWGWILFGGALSILLGALLMAEWPLSGMWAVGVLLGVDLLYSGWMLAFLGGDLRAAAKALKEGQGAA